MVRDLVAEIGIGTDLLHRSLIGEGAQTRPSSSSAGRSCRLLPDRMPLMMCVLFCYLLATVRSDVDGLDDDNLNKFSCNVVVIVIVIAMTNSPDFELWSIESRDDRDNTQPRMPYNTHTHTSPVACRFTHQHQGIKARRLRTNDPINLGSKSPRPRFPTCPSSLDFGWPS